jgi:methionyl-tRNA formyltransferase
MIRFLGSKRQGLESLRVLLDLRYPVEVYTLDDRSDARSCLGDILAVAREHACPITVVPSSGVLPRAAYEPADLMVVIGWYRLLPEPLLQVARHGAVGVHNSLLPRYRGGAPLVWALLHGESVVGASLFSLGSGMDDGPIWSRISVEVLPDDDIGTVLNRLVPASALMLQAAVPRILAGTIVPEPQRHEEATYAAQRTTDDGVINWQRSAQDIQRFVRAQTAPYPGAFTYLGRQRLRLWQATALMGQVHATPGQVTDRTDSSVHVACGDGRVLALHAVSLDGAVVPAPTVVRSRAIRFPQVPLLLDDLAP